MVAPGEPNGTKPSSRVKTPEFANLVLVLVLTDPRIFVNEPRRGSQKSPSLKKRG